MPMWKFRLLEWIGGFVYLAHGLAQNPHLRILVARLDYSLQPVGV